ncbi:hypothetical protein Pmar_PMAR023595 [Perkinsus marinus ATCC 50983]|uniref:Uncharacterized protein n=1 Tax=Perkinsus marinus (strain ATCC 50983 / TXsc) TaxID=423536 RepID=C5KCS5_PERM5|nr:hypothetical protein Pmar_PMAR023595 [Perkinsus marinus ATCC 50983]EER17674.1 hypothetical protein Pmar_PMAR023595 [Perkinsus marinus ATCC 50983]|eukprot:XP_002785878.1 hypothetical protein Pmar_PMAR023595 [Perkinsus marinus ATCC 50983]
MLELAYFTSQLMLQQLRLGVSSTGAQVLGTRHFTVIAAPSSTEATRQQLKSKSSQNLKVAWFTANWCAPCRSIAPRVRRMGMISRALLNINRLSLAIRINEDDLIRSRSMPRSQTQ